MKQAIPRKTVPRRAPRGPRRHRALVHRVVLPIDLIQPLERIREERPGHRHTHRLHPELRHDLQVALRNEAVAVRLEDLMELMKDII